MNIIIALELFLIIGTTYKISEQLAEIAHLKNQIK